MRIKLSHSLLFHFDEPARSLTYVLRLTPRSHDGQRVMRWRIDLEPDCRLKAGEDHFGNLTHTLSLQGPITDLRVLVHGELANYDVAGVVRGSAERLPTELFMRETPLTTPDAEIRAFADDVTAAESDGLAKLHLLMGASSAALVANHEAGPLPAASVFAAGRGSAQGIAHVFVACARHLGFPARCVTGYHVPDEGPQRRHAWAEVHVERLGWVAFDPMHDVCPQDMHIRTAIGLDSLEASGLRGMRFDGLSETVDATWRFEADRRIQIQAQTSAGDTLS